MAGEIQSERFLFAFQPLVLAPFRHVNINRRRRRFRAGAEQIGLARLPVAAVPLGGRQRRIE